MKIKKFKIIGISLLILALFVVLFISIRGQKQEISGDVSPGESIEITETPELTDDIEPSEKIKPIEKQKPPALDKGTIAIVNNIKITENQLNDQFQSLPPAYKDEFKNDMEGFLDQLVVRELLFQHAEQNGFLEGIDANDSEQRKVLAIEKFFETMSTQIQISDVEIKSFYDDHISEMRGASLEQVKSNIKNYIMQQKQGELVNQTIEQLKKESQITYNEQWLNKQRALKPVNPMETALKSGLPTVLDLGASSCIPCKMMKPIFAELEQSLKGKANVILLEISDHRDLARQYRVRVIPTQIFFDTKGEVYWRHEGFLPKEEIIKKLNEAGME